MNKLDELRKDLQGTFIDAFGNSDGADELFDSIVNATEERIIKQLEYFGTDNGKPFNPLHCDTCLMIASLIAFIKEENK